MQYEIAAVILDRRRRQQRDNFALVDIVWPVLARRPQQGGFPGASWPSNADTSSGHGGQHELELMFGICCDFVCGIENFRESGEIKLRQVGAESQVESNGKKFSYLGLDSLGNHGLFNVFPGLRYSFG